jgi:hypothetical protein
MKKNWLSALIYTFLTLTLINAACDDLDLIPKKRKKNDLAIVDGPAKKLAVFPGGGVNAYTSLYLAKLFADKIKTTNPGAGIYDSFDQAWGLSGGSIVASMLMVSYQNNENQALTDFEATVNASFTNIKQIIEDLRNGNVTAADPLDGNGARRTLLEQAIINNAGMNAKRFGDADTKKLVIIAAELSNKKPVYYADPDENLIRLPKDSLRATNTTLLTTAIINSSNFRPAIKFGQEDNGGLFQIVPDTLMPDNKNYSVIDGAHVRQTLDDGLAAVSMNHPLGLAIDYLKKIKPNDGREHQIVVFDNGSGPGAYAKKLNFNNGYAKIEKDGVIINVYFIAVEDAHFNDHTYDITPASFKARRKLVKDAINPGAPSKTIFDSAVKAIK